MNHRNYYLGDVEEIFLCLINYSRLHQYTGCGFQLGLDIHCLMRIEGECISAFLKSGFHIVVSMFPYNWKVPAIHHRSIADECFHIEGVCFDIIGRCLRCITVPAQMSVSYRRSMFRYNRKVPAMHR